MDEKRYQELCSAGPKWTSDDLKRLKAPSRPIDARGHVYTDGCGCGGCAQDRAERDAGGPDRTKRTR